MTTKRGDRSGFGLDAGFPGAKRRKSVPHEFVLEALEEAEPRTNPMFGCLAVYVGEKIVLILRDKRDETAKTGTACRAPTRKDKDNGVWIATTQENHESLRKEFPNMRSVGLLGKKITGWQVLGVDTADFETAALRACELVLAKDERIGKVPGKKKKK